MRPEIEAHLKILQQGQTVTMKRLDEMLAEPNPDAGDFLELMKGYSHCGKMVIELVREVCAHERMEPAR